MAPELNVCRTIDDLQDRLAFFREKTSGLTGLVPTMGFFHEGHLSLMRDARTQCDLVVVSIFVNPTQFGESDDLDAYPSDTERDVELARAQNVDLIFAPTAAEMYPPGYETTVNPGSIAEGLCGLSRPGHFQGVATVVAKLFNIVEPDAAWFGQKDAQQVSVIKRMVRDLNFKVDIKVCPIVRENDGLALSSRNVYMSPEERQQASILYQALKKAQDKVEDGEKNASRLKRMMRKTIASNYRVELEYAKIVDPETMQTVQQINGKALAAVAAKVGPARLIDNVILIESKEHSCEE